MPSTSTEAIIRKLADLEAIRDLARRYAHCVWQKDAQGAANLFTEDAVMDTGFGPPLVGRTALFESYSQVLGDGHFQPFVHNHVIELDGDTASGTCYLDLRSVSAGKSMVGAGYYNDNYVRVGDQWKFKSRKLNMAWLVPLREGWAK